MFFEKENKTAKILYISRILAVLLCLFVALKNDTEKITEDTGFYLFRPCAARRLTRKGLIFKLAAYTPPKAIKRKHYRRRSYDLAAQARASAFA